MSKNTRLGRAKKKLELEQRKLTQIRARARTRDAKSKYRLGVLCEIAGIDFDSVEGYELLIKSISDSLHSMDHDLLEVKGAERFVLNQGKKVVRPSFRNSEYFSNQTHKRITVGGLFVKYQLAQYKSAVLLGALLVR